MQTESGSVAYDPWQWCWAKHYAQNSLEGSGHPNGIVACVAYATALLPDGS